MTRGEAVAADLPAPEALLARLCAQGFVVIEDALAPAEVAQLASELEPWLECTPRCEGDFYGWRTTRVGGLLDKAPKVQELALHPRMLALARALLMPYCDCIQLNLTQAVRVHPGERAQAPHRDEEMWPADKGGGHWLMNVMWAVSAFTEENGATRIWPGSQNSPLDRSVDPRDSVAAKMKPGSALVFLGSVTHGAGANQSDAPRTGVIVSYCLGWLRQYENQYLAYPPDVAARFSEPLQRLMGYQIHRPNLGGWEGRDPIERLGQANRIGPHIDALPPAIASELRALYAQNACEDGFWRG